MRNVLFILPIILLTTTNIAISGWVFEGKWGSYGTGDGQFDRPCGIDIATNGNVYVAEYGNNRVQYFTSSGTFIGKWGPYGTGDGQFDRPFDISIGPNGKAYVTDTYNHRVQYFHYNLGQNITPTSLGIVKALFK